MAVWRLSPHQRQQVAALSEVWDRAGWHSLVSTGESTPDIINGVSGTGPTAAAARQARYDNQRAATAASGQLAKLMGVGLALLVVGSVIMALAGLRWL